MNTLTTIDELGFAPALQQDVLEDTTSDHALLEATRSGDQDAFAELVSRYRNQITSYIYRMTNDYDGAVDLAQETFVRVYRAADRYQRSYAFSTYIYRIATNLALNWLRDHRHEVCHQRLDNAPPQFRLREPQARTPNMEEFLLRDVRLAEVRAAIQELPANHRAAVLMHKYQELDYVEMARVMNCSVPAIKSLLFRAYENLPRRLAHLDPLAQRPAA